MFCDLSSDFRSNKNSMFDFAIRIRISNQTISSDYRAIALSTYHRYECKIMDFLIASGMSIVCFMAYKAIVQKPFSYFLENRDKFEEHNEASGVKIQVDNQGKPVETYLSNDYKNYFNLVTHR